MVPIRQLSAEAATPLRRFLARLRNAVASIDARRVRDDRKVMLGCLQRDLTAAGEALEILESEVAECAALYEHLQTEAARIARRDGYPIAPDDPKSYRGRPRNLSTVESHATQTTRQPSHLGGSQEKVCADFPGTELSRGGRRRRFAGRS